jgi:hypothetical protein
MSNKLTALLKSTQSWIKKNRKYGDLLKNRWILYLVFIISLVQLYSFAVSGEEAYVVVFVLVGYLSTFFSKNMIVILCLALVATSLFKYGSRSHALEGFEDNNSEKEDSKPSNPSKPSKPSKPSTTTNTDDPEKAFLKQDEKAVSKSDEKAVSKPQHEPTVSDLKDMKEKVQKMSKQVDNKGATEEQKMQFQKLLDLQTRLIDGVSGINPLLNEARTVLKELGKSAEGM